MGLCIYISSDKLAPRKYRFYDEDGIKGSWLIPYRLCRNPNDGMYVIQVIDYLKKFPSWEDVDKFIIEAELSKCWTKEDHENFHEALVFYAKYDPKSMVIMDW